MKLVALVESNWEEFGNILNELGERQSVCLSTELIGDEECDVLEYSMNSFLNSEMEVMLIKYSGEESVTKYLGDICPEMLISVSYNVESLNYMEHPVETFLKLVTLLEKENIDKCQKCNLEKHNVVRLT